jgi:hypothetical protein
LTAVNAQNFPSTDIICRDQRFLLCERADSGQSQGQSTMKDSHLNDDQDWFLTTCRRPAWMAVRDFSNGADKEDQGLLPPNGGHTDATVTRASADSLPAAREVDSHQGKTFSKSIGSIHSAMPVELPLTGKVHHGSVRKRKPGSCNVKKRSARG